MPDPTERFTTLVDDYARYRPGYPDAVVELLEYEGVLPGAVIDAAGRATAKASVADVGCGTGLSSLPFLRRGYRVHGVEPNAAMRSVAAKLANDWDSFQVTDGSAEATGLPNAYVDLVVAGQAFHWFRLDDARREFSRILRPKGHVVVMWNSRSLDSEFARDYEALLLEFGTDYKQVRHENLAAEALTAFFPHGFRHFELANEQLFDWAGLRGRLLSSSFVPPAGHPRHDVMVNSLARLFHSHARSGTIRFEYITGVYVGR